MNELKFKTAFKYPFNRAKGMWNILWFLLPIFGWFALGGYSIRLVQEFCKGKFKQLPIFKFSKDLKLGFFMFLKAIPFMLVYVIVTQSLNAIHEAFSIVVVFLAMFIVPILSVNFMKKQTVASFFEFRLIKVVFNNFGDYIIVMLKSILLGIIFLIMILVLVGIPASQFTKNMFLADFYRRRVK